MVILKELNQYRICKDQLKLEQFHMLLYKTEDSYHSLTTVKFELAITINQHYTGMYM